MNLLIDTHILLWWLDNAARLNHETREAIQEPANRVFVSAATIWEIAIKSASGKLDVPTNLDAALEHSRFQELPIRFSHAVAAGRLPEHHRDPFDRMLIAQAQCEKLTLVTHDERIRRYEVTLL
jgi:PIN domain nuclease of toxin-antitoxin system